MPRHTQEAVIVNDKQTSDMPRHTQEAVIVNDKQTSDMPRLYTYGSCYCK